MLRALQEFEVQGVPTTMPFHRWVLETDAFVRGRVHTKWVEEALAAGDGPKAPEVPAPAVPPPATSPAVRPVRLLVEVDGHRVPVSIWGEQVATAPVPPSASAHGHVAHSGEALVAPMQGTILKVLVEPGQGVEAGQTVVILEAMKMENHIAATKDGTVMEVSVAKGDVVETGQPLAVIK